MKRTPIIEWQASVSHNEGDNKKAFISYYHPIITIYYHRLFIRNQSVNPQKRQVTIKKHVFSLYVEILLILIFQILFQPLTA